MEVLLLIPPIGESLSTKFFLSTANWKDEDLPMTYQYSYQFDGETDWRVITDVQRLSYTSTYLPSSLPPANLTIKVVVTDAYDLQGSANTSVLMNPFSASTAAAISSLADLLSELSNNDPYENTRVISMVASELQRWESHLVSGIDNACPLCSGHGTCPNYNQGCICESGWTLPDCSMSTALFEQIISLKEDAILLLNSSYNRIPNDGLEYTFFGALDDLSSSPYFNTNYTLTLIQNLLNYTVDITDMNKTLDLQKSEYVSNIANNLVEFAGTNDCSCSTRFCDELEYTIELYNSGHRADLHTNLSLFY